MATHGGRTLVARELIGKRPERSNHEDIHRSETESLVQATGIAVSDQYLEAGVIQAHRASRLEDPRDGTHVRSRLDVAVKAVPGWEGRHIGITPITAGLTNHNYLVEADDEAFVLRLAGRDTELLGIDREAECEAGRAAAAAGVGPEVCGLDGSRTSACPGHPVRRGDLVPEADLQRETVLASVVGSLRAFHSCPPISSEFPVFRSVESYAGSPRTAA